MELRELGDRKAEGLLWRLFLVVWGPLENLPLVCLLICKMSSIIQLSIEGCYSRNT